MVNPPAYEAAGPRTEARCNNLVTGLHIQVLYAAIGTGGLAIRLYGLGVREEVDIEMFPSLKIKIYINSLTGSLANPQNKIVGVAYKFTNPRDVMFNCIGLACNHRY